MCLLHDCTFKLLNPADPLMSQSIQAQAVQQNIVQTHISFFFYKFILFLVKKHQISGWILERCVHFCSRHLEYLMVQPWKHHRTGMIMRLYVHANMPNTPKTVTCTFHTMPEGQAAYDSRQKSWLVVHVLCILLFQSVCLPSSLKRHSRVDASLASPGLRGWQLHHRVGTLRLDNDRRGRIDSSGLCWTRMGWGHCSQLILSLVKNQHAAAVQSEKLGCLPTECTLCTRNFTWLIVVAVKLSNKLCSHVFGSVLPELTLSSIHLTLKAKLFFVFVA